jgi:hypothetical protein
MVGKATLEFPTLTGRLGMGQGAGRCGRDNDVELMKNHGLSVVLLSTI